METLIQSVYAGVKGQNVTRTNLNVITSVLSACDEMFCPLEGRAEGGAEIVMRLFLTLKERLLFKNFIVHEDVTVRKSLLTAH